jgi:hypothetical protein
MVLAMNRQAARATLLRMHDPDLFSADLLAPWVPDSTWVYNNLTRPLWAPMATGSEVEKGVCLGTAVVVAAAFAFLPRKGRPRLVLGSAGLFAVLAVVFLCLSFGPTWRFWTIPITRLTPYRALAWLLPPLRFAGSASRMIIMTQLAAAVLAAAGLSRLAGIRSKPRRIVLVVLFGVSLVIESQPRVLLTCPPDVPRWVTVLRDAPGEGAVIDLIAGDRSIDFYYQTVHHRPIAMGDISRISADTAAATASVMDEAARGEYGLLGHEGFAYIVTGSSAPSLRLPVFYSDQAARVYRLP